MTQEIITRITNLSMSNAQYMLCGMICLRLAEEFNYTHSDENSLKIMELIVELDSPENYDTELTPSEGLEQCISLSDYTGVGVIIEEFWDENKNYILDLVHQYQL